MAGTNRASTENSIAATEQAFKDLRDRLLSLSQRFAKTEDLSWEKAERFFTLSKKVDQLREQMSMGLSETKGTSETQVNDARDAEVMSSVAVMRRKSKKDYPKYTVRSDVLIKTGLSRDRRTEYEHAIPKPEFEAVVGRLADLSGRKHFSAEGVLGKVPCPSYQAYLVISLLNERGLLTVPRRGLYTIRHAKQFTTEAQSVWDCLTSG